MSRFITTLLSYLKLSPYSTTPRTKETIESLWKLEKIILNTLDFNDVVQKIVTSILTELGYLNLGYRIVVLALEDKQNGVLRRISHSQTNEARVALENVHLPFEEITISLSDKNNLTNRVLMTKKPAYTTKWSDFLHPPFTEEEALTAQKAAGIKTSLIYPVILKETAIGILIFSMVKEEKDVSDAERDLIRGFTDVVGLAVQNAKLYSTLEATSEKLKLANEQLKEMDKLKDEFISITSHELRTPMTAIKSYVWMVLNRHADTLTPKTHEYLDRVFKSSERLINLVNDMLNVSRIESGRIILKATDFDLVELARDIENEVHAKLMERQLTMEIEAEKEKIMVYADREKIQQIFENLVGNALKFTPEKGRLKIKLTSDEKMGITAVSDNGSGISEEDKDKLFKKFSRLDNTVTAGVGGTGLGLFITKQFVELSGGKIWVESKVGEGTTFYFSLPVRPAPIQSEQAGLPNNNNPAKPEAAADT